MALALEHHLTILKQVQNAIKIFFSLSIKITIMDYIFEFGKFNCLIQISLKLLFVFLTRDLQCKHFIQNIQKSSTIFKLFFVVFFVDFFQLQAAAGECSGSVTCSHCTIWCKLVLLAVLFKHLQQTFCSVCTIKLLSQKLSKFSSLSTTEFFSRKVQLSPNCATELQLSVHCSAAVGPG